MPNGVSLYLSVSPLFQYNCQGHFIQLVDSVSERDFPGELWIATLPEIREQDLTGFEVSPRDAKKAKAEQEVAMLEHFADCMGAIYGERPTVPMWARASARIPDDYT